MRTYLALILLTACGGSTPCEGAGCVGMDAGDRDAAPIDAQAASDAPSAPDASLADAGMRCPAPVTPAAFDCATEDPTLTFGAPITADPMTWTFIPFDDAFCMNGTSTGIGVNLNPASDRVLIYLEGGGACFDLITCAGVAGLNGFGARDLANGEATLARGLFARDATNPMADWNFVYVPYCTGDVHGGTNDAGPSGRHHVGYRNVTAYLRRLVPTFSTASLVLLAGRSAGGLGTLVNFDQVQRAFDCTQVHLLDDAGAVLGDDYLKPCLQSTVRELWGVDAILPGGCPQCLCSDGGGLSAIYPYLATRYPAARFGLISGTEDQTFRSFYSYGYSASCRIPGNMPGEEFRAGLLEVRSSMSAFDNFRTFYVPGDRHTFTGSSLASTSVGGTTLTDWVGQLVAEDPSWPHVGP